MNVLIKKINENAVIPRYAHAGDSGFDLVAMEDVELRPGETKLVSTGLSFGVPTGYELQVRPRSGVSLKTALIVKNSPGTVDSSYSGEVKVIMSNINSPTTGYNKVEFIKKGDRIAQGVICPVMRATFTEVDSLDETERGSGGFGSSGK